MNFHPHDADAVAELFRPRTTVYPRRQPRRGVLWEPGTLRADVVLVDPELGERLIRGLRALPD